MTRRFRNDWRTLLDVRDERIYLTNIFDERFQRLVEIFLKVSRLWQVLSFPGQLRCGKHRHGEMGPHINEFGMFDALPVFCLIYHK